MNPNKLRSVMVLHGDTIASLARAMGITAHTLGRKIHGKTEFTQREIWFIKNRYGLTPAEVDEIFFEHRVS